MREWRDLVEEAAEPGEIVRVPKPPFWPVFAIWLSGFILGVIVGALLGTW